MLWCVGDATVHLVSTDASDTLFSCFKKSPKIFSLKSDGFVKTYVLVIKIHLYAVEKLVFLVLRKRPENTSIKFLNI